MERVFGDQFSKDLLLAYYNEAGNIVIPEPMQEGPEAKESELERKALATQTAANFASLGYRLDENTVIRLAQASKEDILSFYDTYMTALEDQIGSRFQKAQLFYPDFPEQVINKNRIEIMFDQIIYGLSGFKYLPTGEHDEEMFSRERTIKRFPFIGRLQERPMQVIPAQGSEKDAKELINERIDMAIHSLKPYTYAQMNLIEQAIKSDNKYVLRDANLPNHENRAILSYLACKNHQPKLTKQILTEAKDVLRFATLMSTKPENEKIVENMDITKASFKIPRSSRKQVFGILEEIAKKKDLTVETWQDKETWKRLYKQAHIGEYEKQFPAVSKSAQDLRHNLTPERYESVLEKSLKEQDLDQALKLLKQRPGVLMRRLDHVLRIADSQPKDVRQEKVQMVLDTVKEAALHAGISTVFDSMQAIQKRDKDENIRRVSYMHNGHNKVIDISSKARTAFSDQTMQQIKDMSEQIFTPRALSPRFAGKDIGKVYISPEMEYYTVPMQTRQVSPGIESFGSGSAIKVDNEKADTQRMFVHWTNIAENGYDSRVDIDLSARIVYADYSAYVSWNRSYNENGVTYSGDIQNGGSPDGPGAAEYIDIDTQKLKENGAKYVIVNINSYTSQAFSQQPNSYFGWMERSKEDYGDHFEPGTVKSRFKLLGNSTNEVAALYDVQRERMVWIDQPLIGHIATENEKDVDAIIQQMIDKSITIEDLAKANGIANEGYTKNPELMAEADTLFMTRQELEEAKEIYPDVDFDSKKIIFPSDLAYLTSVLLADGPDIDKSQVHTKQKSLEQEITESVPAHEKEQKAKQEERKNEHEQEHRHSSKGWVR